MIKTKTLEDGRTYTYSDRGIKIRQETGIIYDEAVDIIPHTYTETDIPVEDISAEEALNIITGVSE